MGEDREDQDEKDVVYMNGSHGAGVLALVTIVTSSPAGGEIERSFEFPYALVDQKRLTLFTDNNLIRGYRIAKIETPKESL